MKLDGVVRDLGDLVVRAAQAGDHARDQQRHAVATGVHHAVLAQYREQLRTALHGGLSRLECLFEHLGQRLVLIVVGGILVEARPLHVCQLGRNPVRHLTHDRDHGPLGRIAHGGIGGVGGARQGSGHQHGVDQLAGTAGQLLRRAAHDLGQDHPAVATGPEERRPRHGLDDLVAADVVDHLAVQAVELRHHGPQRLRHVVSGVAVGDREHVQVVDFLTACLQLGIARCDNLPKALYGGIGQENRCREGGARPLWPPCPPSGTACTRTPGEDCRSHRCGPSAGSG